MDVMYYPCSLNKGADQLLGSASLFSHNAKSWIPHDTAQVMMCSGGHNNYYIACWCWTPRVSCEGGGGWEHTFNVLSEHTCKHKSR